MIQNSRVWPHRARCRAHPTGDGKDHRGANQERLHPSVNRRNTEDTLDRSYGLRFGLLGVHVAASLTTLR
jgi:hypothetical protein